MNGLKNVTREHSLSVYGERSASIHRFLLNLLPPATKLGQGYIFTGVCDSVNRGGVRGCWGGACVVAPGGGHVWFLPGGACVVALGGGMRGCSGGHAWLLPGRACMVFAGGHAWFFLGGACVGYDEIRSMSGRYASYWNAFLLYIVLHSASSRTRTHTDAPSWSRDISQLRGNRPSSPGSRSWGKEIRNFGQFVLPERFCHCLVDLQHKRELTDHYYLLLMTRCQ